MLKQLRFLWGIRSRHFDCVLDLTDGDRSAIITGVSGASKRIGFNNENRWRGIVYSQCVEAKYGSMHMIDYHGQVASELGIQPTFGLPEVFVSSKDEEVAQQRLQENQLDARPWVMIHPTARYWSKAWPAERFAALSDWFAKQGTPVVLAGSKKDRKTGLEIQRMAESNPVSLMGETSVLELAALMKRCVLFVGNDGGPLHIAAAVGCPVLAIFGPTDPAVWGPRGDRVSVLYKGLDCDACFLPGCLRGEESCMKLISVDEVLSR
jgi:heptosyltransferase-3